MIAFEDRGFLGARLRSTPGAQLQSVNALRMEHFWGLAFSSTPGTQLLGQEGERSDSATYEVAATDLC